MGPCMERIYYSTCLPLLMALKLALTEGTLQALELEFTLQMVDLDLGLGLNLDHHI